jgi:hypothetical protein
MELHETLLEMQGSANLTRRRVEFHLAALTRAFDFARTIIQTPYRFASDISDVWIVATYSRCLAILHNDAHQDIQLEYAEGFHELLEDLGITSFSDLQHRSEQTKKSLPMVWKVADATMTSNPAVTD